MRHGGRNGGRECATVVVPMIRQVVSSDASSLLLKTVHDFYNRGGVEVRNALGQVWTTVGDAHLGGSGDTIAMGTLASKASRDAVQDVLATGGTTRAQAALDYIPDMASVAGRHVRVDRCLLHRSGRLDARAQPVALLDSGDERPLPVDQGKHRPDGSQGPEGGAGCGGRRPQLGRGIQSTAEAAGRRIEQGVEDIRSAPARLEREIERQYGLPPR